MGLRRGSGHFVPSNRYFANLLYYSHISLFPLFFFQFGEVTKPFLHRTNLPLMRLHDKLRLSIHIQNPIAISMMSTPGNQILGMQVILLKSCWRVITMIAYMKPHIRVPIDKG
jgi:hypothetical protein